MQKPDDHHMLSSHPSQAAITGYAFTPYEDRWPATSWGGTPSSDRLPSLADASRSPGGRRRRTLRRTRLIKRLA